jgi:phospholipid/cholesterol/gamma-HCH transport system ATP-binding protein
MSQAVIEFKKVVKSFGRQIILDKVDLTINSGMTTVVAGPSGQGKSVTMKLILGLLRPDSGQIMVEGQDISQMRIKALREIRTKFGVLFQGSALLDSLTVFANVALPLEERTRLGSEEIRERVFATLGQLGLTGAEDKYPAQLSGGMRKRVGLARALMLQPEIMLFDEPTTGLDPETTLEIYKLFLETQKKFGYTSIIVSHDIPKIFNLADQVILINKGKFSTFASPEDIQQSELPEIQAFVQNAMGKVYSSREMEERI